MRIRNLIAVLTSLCAALPVPAAAALCACPRPAEAQSHDCCCGSGHHGDCEMESAPGTSATPEIAADDACTTQVGSAPVLADAEPFATKSIAPAASTPDTPSTYTDATAAGSFPSPPTGSPPLSLSCILRC